MKNLIRLLFVLGTMLTSSASGQSCKSQFNISSDNMCRYIFTNQSDSTFPYKWIINGDEHKERNPILGLDVYETFNVCLMVEDTANHCADTLCKTLKGRKKVSYDYYVYKQQLCLTSLYEPRNGSLYLLSLGYNNDALFNTNGLFKYTYLNPGKYRVVLGQYDTVRIYNDTFAKKCSFYKIDSIEIGNNGQCRSYFIPYQQKEFKDSMWIFERTMGENMKFEWDFGDGFKSSLRYPDHTFNMGKRVNVCLKITDTITNCTSNYCDSISARPNLHLMIVGNISFDSKVKKIYFADEVKVYPNPFNKTLQIKVPEVNCDIKWEIYNSLGTRVMEGIVASSVKSVTVDAGALGNGVYVLTLQSGGSSSVYKIIKID